MGLSEIQLADVERRLGVFCAARVPAHARSHFRIGFRVDGSAVVLFEERTAFENPNEWRALDVAKFRWVATRKVWQLFCQHRDNRWHGYELFPESPTFAKLLDEVAADPTGIFWG